MLKYTGKSVYGAIAIGKAFVLKKEKATIRRIHVADAEAELLKVSEAKEKALFELSSIYEKALKEVGESGAQIFDIHMMLLEDEDYNDSIKEIILEQKVNAEYAVSLTANNFSSMFAAMDDSYMQARAADIKDISERLLSHMTMEEKIILYSLKPKTKSQY